MPAPPPVTTPPSTPPDPPSRTRFVIGCQQLLALGAVIAVLTPAASIISLEVVPRTPQGDTALVSERFGEYARAMAEETTVPAAAVTPDVTEYQLTPPRGARAVPGRLAAKVAKARRGGQRVVSEPQRLLGEGTLGVTWARGERVDDDEVEVEVRTRTTGRWSEWMALDYHEEHGPDPDSVEARSARPGTEPVYVGDTERVQVRMTTPRNAPADLRLAVVDPGRAVRTREEGPEIETDADGVAAREGDARAGESEADAELQAAVSTPRPKIFSRRQWGADESLRDKRSLSYGQVHAGFVHHTVNANDYSKSQVPGILRGIYAYHTRSRGWSDIGYNFLVDKFGRIWEGRAGGVARPVNGAHTLGYNHVSFAMSAIGNFENVRPGAVMKQAYGALFAWKLSLHGVAAASGKQWLAGKRFRAINGHRDAGSTACPGRYLYEQLPNIRGLARDAQRGWSGRELESNLVPGRMPDLVVRRAKDGAGMVLPIRKSNGRHVLGKPVSMGVNLSKAHRIMKAGDWTRNGKVDVMYRTKDFRLFLVRQRQDGTWANPLLLRRDFGGKLLGAVGDWNGDGWPDLVAQRGHDKPLLLFPGKGAEGLRKAQRMRGPVDGGVSVPVGRWNGDGAPDLITRKGRQLTLHIGNGPGGIVRSKQMGRDVGQFDWVIGMSDMGVTTPAHADLVVRRRSDQKVFVIPGSTSGLGKAIAVGDSRRAQQFDLAG